MKYISKTLPPADLTSWVAAQQGHADPVNYPVTYEKLGAARKTAVVRQYLESEQFGLCGYTCEALDEAMKRPNTESHIEHIKPVSECKIQAGASYGTIAVDDLDYYNMIAATYVRSSRVEWYGAREKDDKYEPALFISPLNALCETKFKYLVTGDIRPHPSTDASSIRTIQLLKLDHSTLVNARKAAISVALPSPDATSYSVAELQKVINEMQTVDVNGRLPNFSFVIKQIAEDFLQVIQSP